MDLTRFRELYEAEAREHLRLLGSGLLALESGEVTTAVAESFRAAHTVKGLAATMGYTSVGDIAHRLEDQLERVRSGQLHVDAALIDELLGLADRLEAAVVESLAVVPVGATPVAVTAADPASGLPVGLGAGRDAVVVRVRIDDAAPVKAARALLVLRAVERIGQVHETAPAAFDDSFAGELHMVVAKPIDRAALEAAIRAAGDVAEVTFPADRAVQATAPAPVPAAAGKAATPAAGRHVRVEQRRLDELAEAIAELSVLHARLTAPPLTATPLTAAMLGKMRTLIADLQLEMLTLRMVAVAEVFDRMPRLVRDTARQLGREVELVLEGRDIRLDRVILDEIADPLVHLVRNAIDHGVEAPDIRIAAGKPPKGRLTLRAERERSSVRIVLQDDGRGVDRARVVARAIEAGLVNGDVTANIPDEEVLRLLSHAGLSTAEQVTGVSGRGVGLDVVVHTVRALGGAIDMHSEPGQGTTFTLRLPITLALVHALRVRVGDEDYAIPLTHVAEAIEFDDSAPERAGSREFVFLRDEPVPVVRLREVLGITPPGSESAAVVTERGERRTALAVDELVGHEQILVKPFDPASGTLPIFSGATLLADGRPALVLDPLSVG